MGLFTIYLIPMKKIFLSLLVLGLSINPSFAFVEKAKVKVGKVSALIKKGANNTNFVISKSGTLFTLGLGYSKIVISRNPSSTTITSSLTFAVPGGDFESGTTYDLLPPANPLNDDGYNLNAIVTATKTKGSKSWGVSTLGDGVVDPRAFGKLKVIKYDPETGELKAKLIAYFTPSTSGKVGNQKLSTKKIPYIATIQAILD